MNAKASTWDKNAWVPKLRGRIYCSPACGADCTKAAYDLAVNRATKLATTLGRGWKLRVWENMGWYYAVEKGDMSVREARHGCTAYFNTDAGQYIGRGDTPKEAVLNALLQARGALVTITEAIKKVTA